MMLYYSALTRPLEMLNPIRARLLDQARRLGFKTCSSCPERLPGFDFAAIQPKGKLPEVIFTAILAGLDQIPRNAIVYLCEDDVLYHDCHFESQYLKYFAYRYPEHECFNYNFNVIHLCPQGFFRRHNQNCPVLSMAWGRADIVRTCCQKKLDEARTWMIPPLPGRPKPGYCFEPTRSLGHPTNHMRSKYASLDIRHANNNTWKVEDGDVMSPTEAGWEDANTLIEKYHIK